MRVLIVSDSHGKQMNLYDAIHRTKPDMILHCGDGLGCEDEMETFGECPVHIVRGNCDSGSYLPTEKVVEIGRHKIFMTHGHRYSRMYLEDDLAAAAKEAGADYVIFGHTHVPEKEIIDGITIINPGSIALPRQEGRIPTYVVLDVDSTGDFHFKQVELNDKKIQTK